MTTINSGTLNYVSAGPVRRETKKEKNSPRRGGHMTGGTHHRNGASYPPTDSSTYSRTWYNRVTPTKRSTQPPCTPAVQQMTYTAVGEVERERRNNHGSGKQKHETCLTPRATNTFYHPPTHPPTDPTHPSTDPTTHRPTNLPTRDVLQQYSRVQQQQQQIR